MPNSSHSLQGEDRRRRGQERKAAPRALHHATSRRGPPPFRAGFEWWCGEVGSLLPSQSVSIFDSIGFHKICGPQSD
mgnify:CR=1 FL=1|jgi:hypothetical protein